MCDVHMCEIFKCSRQVIITYVRFSNVSSSGACGRVHACIYTCTLTCVCTCICACANVHEGTSVRACECVRVSVCAHTVMGAYARFAEVVAIVPAGKVKPLAVRNTADAFCIVAGFVTLKVKPVNVWTRAHTYEQTTPNIQRKTCA